MKTNKNEELQSRREFFKSAVKAALPVVGAIVLSHVPNFAKASEMGCNGSCYHSCYSGCNMTCLGACKGGCQGTCQGSCRTSCQGMEYSY